MTYRLNYDANPDTEERANMTRAQAIQHIKRSTNRTYYVHTRVNAPVAAEPDTKVFPLSACIPLTRAQAVKFVEDVLEGRFETEALMPVTTYRNCIFLG